jgi:hypothetical protein
LVHKKIIANTDYAKEADKFFAVYDAFEEYRDQRQRFLEEETKIDREIYDES